MKDHKSIETFQKWRKNFYQNPVTLLTLREIVPKPCWQPCMRSESENTVYFLNYTLEANIFNEIPELVHSSFAIGTDSPQTPPVSFWQRLPSHTHTQIFS